MGRPKDSSAEVSKERLADISKFLSDGIFPEGWKDRGVRANWRRMCSSYVLQDGTLFKRQKRDGSYILIRVITSEEERKKILRSMHEGADCSVESRAVGAHIGRDKLFKKIRDRYYWPGLSIDVRNYVATCDQCQRMSTRFDMSAPCLQSVAVPTSPWTQIGIDITSMPESPGGFSSIVVAVDYFTKWVEAKPLPSKSAKDTARFLYELICRHGCPKIQINDQGREFVNQVSVELHRLIGVKQNITSAYHPQANGLVERNNRTIQSSLLKTLRDEEDWVGALPGVLFAFRTSVQKSTRYTPFFLLYGRQARLPVEDEINPICSSSTDGNDVNVSVFEGCEDTSCPEDIKQRLESLRQPYTVVKDKVSENITQAQDRRKRDYEKRHGQKRMFVVDELVLLWNLRCADRKGGGGGMKAPWQGPYVVHAVNQNQTYILKTPDGTILKQAAHGVNLKPYKASNDYGPQTSTNTGASVPQSSSTDDANIFDTSYSASASVPKSSSSDDVNINQQLMQDGKGELGSSKRKRQNRAEPVYDSSKRVKPDRSSEPQIVRVDPVERTKPCHTFGYFELAHK
ncbi:hypothetical protein BaRGS_00006509 [Batillaria attramentaria]|uniref:Integrase catalytic domain-containing protein n=1 Tax=Batillaria attramentaria TaxID=370345 RepID=A0ABD0LRF0_9CAEN